MLVHAWGSRGTTMIVCSKYMVYIYIYIYIILYMEHCLALPCLGPLAPRGAVGARHDGLPRQFSPLLPVVCHGLSLSEGFAGPLCDVITPASFSACPFFDCLRLFPVVLLWIGRPILSRAHTISVYAALQLPGDLRTVLCALRWFPAPARL